MRDVLEQSKDTRCKDVFKAINRIFNLEQWKSGQSFIAFIAYAVRLYSSSNPPSPPVLRASSNSSSCNCFEIMHLEWGWMQTLKPRNWQACLWWYLMKLWKFWKISDSVIRRRLICKVNLWCQIEKKDFDIWCDFLITFYQTSRVP